MSLTTKYGGGKSIYSPAAIKHAKGQKAKRALRAIKRNAAKYKEPAYTTGMGSEFYLTREWKQTRWQVLTRSDGKCCMCGRGKAQGVILHVDHIHPRSKFPSKELDPTNLQVLCSDCNLGKGATSWKSP